MKIIAPHSPEKTKLAKVTAEMEKLGRPKIRVVFSHNDYGPIYRAIEGSHRLAAAAELELTPELIVLNEEDEITEHDFDHADLANALDSAMEPVWDGKSPITAGIIVAYLDRNWNPPQYSFDD